jgi:hypothetical protein
MTSQPESDHMSRGEYPYRHDLTQNKWAVPIPETLSRPEVAKQHRRDLSELVTKNYKYTSILT